MRPFRVGEKDEVALDVGIKIPGEEGRVLGIAVGVGVRQEFLNARVGAVGLAWDSISKGRGRGIDVEDRVEVVHAGKGDSDLDLGEAHGDEGQRLGDFLAEPKGEGNCELSALDGGSGDRNRRGRNGVGILLHAAVGVARVVHFRKVADHVVDILPLGFGVLHVGKNLHPFAGKAGDLGAVEAHCDLFEHVEAEVADPLELGWPCGGGGGVWAGEGRPDVGDVDADVAVVQQVGVVGDLETKGALTRIGHRHVGHAPRFDAIVLHGKIGGALVELVKVGHGGVPIDEDILSPKGGELHESPGHIMYSL